MTDFFYFLFLSVPYTLYIHLTIRPSHRFPHQHQGRWGKRKTIVTRLPNPTRKCEAIRGIGERWTAKILHTHKIWIVVRTCWHAPSFPSNIYYRMFIARQYMRPVRFCSCYLRDSVYIISRFSQLKVDGEQLERSRIRLTIALGGIFRFVVIVVEHINRSLLSRRLDSLEKPACAGVVYFIDVG
jgi:hypothetical protein